MVQYIFCVLANRGRKGIPKFSSRIFKGSILFLVIVFLRKTLKFVYLKDLELVMEVYTSHSENTFVGQL